MKPAVNRRSENFCLCIIETKISHDSFMEEFLVRTVVFSKGVEPSNDVVARNKYAHPNPL